MKDDTSSLSDAEAEPDVQFLDHPETSEAGNRILTAIAREGDRGATLVAGEMLSEFLANALRSLNTKTLSRKELDALFNASGPLSTWSARTQIAALTGLIGARAFKSLGKFRQLRNKAAHSEGEFSLKQHADELRAALDLGPDFPDGVFGLARELLLVDFVTNLKERGLKIQEELGVNPFESHEDILGVLNDRPEVLSTLGERAWRYQLGIGVWALLGLMRIERDQYLSSLGRRHSAT